MLGRRADRDAAVPADGAEDGEVVGLGAAPGEHHLAGRAAERRGDVVAGLVEGPPGVAGRRGRPLGLANRSARKGSMASDGLGPHRRRGGVVEVGDGVHRHGYGTPTGCWVRVVGGVRRRHDRLVG